MSAIEYGDNGLEFDRAHNKQTNIWEKLHLRLEQKLGDYSAMGTDEDVVFALKEGLKEVQSMLIILNMAPFPLSTMCRDKTWYTHPWLFENKDPKHMAYKLSSNVVAIDDRDREVLRDIMLKTYEDVGNVLDHTKVKMLFRMSLMTI